MRTSSTLRILIVDDHAVVRAGLRALLDAQSSCEVVGEAADGVDACAQARSSSPDVILMDVSMPNLNGVDATRAILRVSPATRVIGLSAHAETAYVRGLMAAGARGYVLKRSLVSHLVHAIDVVARGGIYLDPLLAESVRSASVVDTGDDPMELSAREAEVGSLAAMGHSNAEIASLLHIGVKTVETHKTHLMRKLGIGTRAQLVRYGLHRGWLN